MDDFLIPGSSLLDLVPEIDVDFGIGSSLLELGTGVFATYTCVLPISKYEYGSVKVH